jgi:hypothetical protein
MMGSVILSGLHYSYISRISGMLSRIILRLPFIKACCGAVLRAK